MKFDRNTVIGILILGLLFVGYFWTTSKENAKLREKQAREQFVRDSIAKANVDTIALRKDSLRADSLHKVNITGVFKKPGADTEKLLTIDKDLVRVAFTNKGGQVKWVELKKYKNQDSQWVKLAGTDFDKISYSINTGSNSSAQITDLFFSTVDTVSNADGSTTVTYALNADSGIS